MGFNSGFKGLRWRNQSTCILTKKQQYCRVIQHSWKLSHCCSLDRIEQTQNELWCFQAIHVTQLLSHPLSSDPLIGLIVAKRSSAQSKHWIKPARIKYCAQNLCTDWPACTTHLSPNISQKYPYVRIKFGHV